MSCRFTSTDQYGKSFRIQYPALPSTIRCLLVQIEPFGRTWFHQTFSLLPNTLHIISVCMWTGSLGSWDGHFSHYRPHHKTMNHTTILLILCYWKTTINHSVLIIRCDVNPTQRWSAPRCLTHHSCSKGQTQFKCRRFNSLSGLSSSTGWSGPTLLSLSPSYPETQNSTQSIPP